MATWDTIGVWLYGTVRLAYFNEKLYASSSDNQRIYRWDGGTSWTDVSGSLGSYITALVVVGSALYVSLQSGHVYKYDGVSFSDIGIPIGGEWPISLCGHADDLYAGTNNAKVARYDGSGTSWTSLGDTGLRGSSWWVYALCSWNGQLFAGGMNTNVSIGNVRCWNGGTSWSKAGGVGGANADLTRVQVLYVFNDLLYAGYDDQRDTVGGIDTYDGLTWTNIGRFTGMAYDQVTCICSMGNNLYAGARNTSVYKYNGTITWDRIGIVNDLSYVRSLATDGIYLYASRYDPEKVYSSFQWEPPEIKSENTEVFLVAKNIVMLIFTRSLVKNDAFDSVLSYRVENLSGGIAGTVIKVLPTYTETNSNIIFLQIEGLSQGSDYKLIVADKALSDTDGNLILELEVKWTMHKTKVDAAISGLSKMYNTTIGSNVRSILEAVMISDEKIGGDY